MLIVEDEELLQKAVTVQLKQLGYTVLAAENGLEALEILENRSDVAIVVSDIVMPGGLDGYDLAKQIHVQWPDIAILLTTGFTKNPAREAGAPDEALAQLTEIILDKPYTNVELAAAIRNKLDASSAGQADRR